MKKKEDSRSSKTGDHLNSARNAEKYTNIETITTAELVTSMLKAETDMP